jgi:VanZ family protein
MNPLKPQRSQLLSALLRTPLRYQRHNHHLNIALLVIYGAAVTALSLKTTVEFAPLFYNDKIAHFLTYSLFTLLAWRLSRSNRQYITYATLVFAYSVLIEFIQPYTGRMLSGWDMVANGLGVSLMYLALYRVSYSTAA